MLYGTNQQNPQSPGRDTVYDVDIFLEDRGDGLKVTEEIIHKVNGKARFGYDDADIHAVN